MHVTLQESVAQEIRAEMARQRVTGAELARRLNRSDAWVSKRLAFNGSCTLDELELIAGLLSRPAGHFLPAPRIGAASAADVA